MRLVTFALALLTLASAVAAVLMLAERGWRIWSLPLALFAGGVVLAIAADLASAALARGARMLRRRTGGRRWLGLPAGALPMIAIVAFQLTVAASRSHDGPTPFAVRDWLVMFGVGTGPWLLLAVFKRGFARTLAGIHAYMAQLFFLMMSAVLWASGGRAGLALAAMVLAALPPTLVGALMAIVDRRALPVEPIGRRWRSAGQGRR